MMSESPPATAERETLYRWELLVRLDGERRKEAVQDLAEVYGSNCYFCGQALDLEHATDIHHLDYNQRNNKWANLRLTHHGCNSADPNKPGRVGRPQSPHEREREKAAVGVELQAQEKPVSIVLNEEYEDAFRRFVVTRVSSYGPDPGPDDFIFLLPRNILPAAAEWTGANPKTLYPYLAKMTNPENGFLTTTPYRKTGKSILTYKKPEYYEMDLEEILRRHPKRGLRTYLGAVGVDNQLSP